MNTEEFTYSTYSKSFFEFTITEESDLSKDGGYSFEMVGNSYLVDKDIAAKIVIELNKFIEGKT
jgi:hypothetical protein